jgi:hypothetical protein
MSTPEEDRAATEGMLVVAVTPFELLQAASGRPIVVGTLDGTEVMLRLATPDELVSSQQRASEKLAAQGIPAPPPMSRAQAELLVRPLAV